MVKRVRGIRAVLPGASKGIVMLRLVLASACLLAASPALAAHKSNVTATPSGEMGWTQSENANANACFGQARAYYAEMLGNDERRVVRKHDST